jgi:hypothetical protein
VAALFFTIGKLLNRLYLGKAAVGCRMARPAHWWPETTEKFIAATAATFA